MRNFQCCFLLFALALSPLWSAGQEGGQLRGDLMVNSAFYINDDRLGQYGTNTTQYQREKSSAETWLFLNYTNKGYDINVRYDLFHNSPLLNPQESYTDQGLPFFNVSKTFDNLTLTVGSFYDQFGSGVLFRAYEDRTIGLDFAMQGVKLEYNYKDKLRFKAFTGRQKFRFDTHPQVVQGINVEGSKFGKKLGLTYGASAVKRTLDFESDIQANIAPTINSQKLEDRFVPKMNVYGGQVYGTLSYGKFSLNLDVAAKTEEAVFDFRQKLVNKSGLFGMAILSFNTKGFGVSVQGKYSDYFAMRTNPYTATSAVLVGTVGFLSPINRQNTYRLPARYSPAVQELSEQGIQVDVKYAPDRKNIFNANFSYIESPEITDEVMFQEIFFSYQKKLSKKVKGTIGIQNVLYNQKLYEGKSSKTPNVKTITPFIDLLVKMKNRKSFRTELHYLKTEEDLGDFAFGLVELTFSSKYSLTISDMLNTKPREDTRNANVKEGELVHYPTVFLAITHHQTRFTAGFIKQVEGVVCNGGVCRLEPAFSGFRFGLTTNF